MSFGLCIVNGSSQSMPKMNLYLRVNLGPITLNDTLSKDISIAMEVTGKTFVKTLNGDPKIIK